MLAEVCNSGQVLHLFFGKVKLSNTAILYRDLICWKQIVWQEDSLCQKGKSFDQSTIASKNRDLFPSNILHLKISDLLRWTDKLPNDIINSDLIALVLIHGNLDINPLVVWYKDSLWG